MAPFNFGLVIIITLLWAFVRFQIMTSEVLTKKEKTRINFALTFSLLLILGFILIQKHIHF